MVPDMAWIPQGHVLNMVRVRISYIRSEMLNTTQHNTLPILKYPGIIARKPQEKYQVSTRVSYRSYTDTLGLYKYPSIIAHIPHNCLITMVRMKRWIASSIRL